MISLLCCKFTEECRRKINYYFLHFLQLSIHRRGNKTDTLTWPSEGQRLKKSENLDCFSLACGGVEILPQQSSRLQEVEEKKKRNFLFTCRPTLSRALWRLIVDLKLAYRL